MPSVTAVDKSIENIYNKLIGVNQKISEAYIKYIDTVTVGSTDEQVLQNDFLNDYNSKADMYDRLFQEQEAKFQKAGGKRTRGNTIQEYVILLFFVGFFIFSASISMYLGFLENSTQTGWTVFGMMCLIMFISGGYFVSYA
jgi:hypothetical protein